MESHDTYNTKEGIESCIKQGIAGFRDLLTARARGHHLKTWIVLGRWVLTEYGELQGVEELSLDHANPPDHANPRIDLRPCLPRVVEFSSLKALGNVRAMFLCSVDFPRPGDRCFACDRPWTMEDAHDRVKGREFQTSPTLLRDQYLHTICARILARRHQRERFTHILEEAGILLYDMQAIANEYDSRSLRPWFEVTTPYGVIKMGWRKHVISIQWPSTIEVDFSAEQVTQEPGLIHAWGEPKAMEYLTAIGRRMRELG